MQQRNVGGLSNARVRCVVKETGDLDFLQGSFTDL